MFERFGKAPAGFQVEEDDPEAEDVQDKEAFSNKPGSPGAVRLANFIRAASSSRVGIMFGYKGKPVKGDLKKKIIKHLMTPKQKGASKKPELKESNKAAWKLSIDGVIKRVIK